MMQLEFDMFGAIFSTSLPLGLNISSLAEKAFQKVPIKTFICYPSEPLRLALREKSQGLDAFWDGRKVRNSFMGFWTGDVS